MRLRSRRSAVAVLVTSALLALAGCQDHGSTRTLKAPAPIGGGAATAAPRTDLAGGSSSLTGDAAFNSPDLLANGSCRDPWVTSAVVYVNGSQNTPTGRACDTKLYGGGSWSSYSDLVSKVTATMRTCGDRWVTQAVLEVVGRLPSYSECSIYRYGGGSWSSYQDLKSKVRAAFSTPPAAPAPPPPAPAPVLAAPSITSAVYGGNLGPGKITSWLRGTGLERASAVVYGAGTGSEVSVPITAMDRNVSNGVTTLQVVSPLGADLAHLAVTSPQGRSNVVAVTGIPGVPRVTSAVYGGNLGPGILKIWIEGSNLDQASEVLYGAGAARISQQVRSGDYRMLAGRPVLEMLPPSGADLSSVVVVSPAGYANAVSVTGLPGVASVTSARYVSRDAYGNTRIRIEGAKLDQATEVLFGRVPNRISVSSLTKIGSYALELVAPKAADLTYVVVTTQGGYASGVAVTGVPPAPGSTADCASRRTMIDAAYNAVFGRSARSDEMAYWLSLNCVTDGRLANQAALEAQHLQWLATSDAQSERNDMVQRAFERVYGSAPGTRKLAETYYGTSRRSEWQSKLASSPRRFSTLVSDVSTWMATHPTRTRYVALGDSFSSGEGAPPFYDTTWIVKNGAGTMLNNCHQSSVAYSVKLAKDLARQVPTLTDFDFEACSGAVLDNINGGIKQYSGLTYQQQLDAVDNRAGLITVGIGGNDMGFANVLAYCVFHTSCQDWFKGQSHNRKEDMADNNISVMYSRLVHFYGQLKAKSDDAPIYVLSYPNLFSTTTDLAAPAWALGQGSGFDKGETAWIQGKLTKFNQTIAKAAQAAGVHYVDVNTAWGAGHEYQMTNTWLNTFSFTGQVATGDGEGKYAFHPTASGQNADYLALLSAGAHYAQGNPIGSTPAGAPAMPDHWWTIDKMDTTFTGTCGLSPACKPLDVNEGEDRTKYLGAKTATGTKPAPFTLTLHPAKTGTISGKPVIYYFEAIPSGTQVDQEVAKHNWCAGPNGNWHGSNWFGSPYTDGDRQYVICGK